MIAILDVERVLEDGADDMDLFDPVDLKVALNAKEIVRKRADAKVEGKNLRPIVNLVGAELEKDEGSGEPETAGYRRSLKQQEKLSNNHSFGKAMLTRRNIG